MQVQKASASPMAAELLPVSAKLFRRFFLFLRKGVWGEVPCQSIAFDLAPKLPLNQNQLHGRVIRSFF